MRKSKSGFGASSHSISDTAGRRLDGWRFPRHNWNMFINPGDPPPPSKDDPTNVEWVVDDILRQRGAVNLYQFRFEFPKVADPVITRLLAAGADSARRDGSSNIAVVVAKASALHPLVEICLSERGVYLKNLSVLGH